MEIHTAGGVGYELRFRWASTRRFRNVGDEVALHTHLVVRDDAWLLFGFATASEKRVFQRLLTANGVGPALALGMLSHADAPTVSCARSARRTSRRCRACRAWERRRRSDWCSISPTSSMTWPAVRWCRAAVRKGPSAEDAIRALVSLGYAPWTPRRPCAP